jgi:hypothetical protein
LANSGWFVKGTDYCSIIYHEIGHIYEKLHKISISQTQEHIKVIFKTDSIEKALKILAINLSQYSALADGEIVSEMFSAYFSGRNDDFILTFIEKIGIFK